MADESQDDKDSPALQRLESRQEDRKSISWAALGRYLPIRCNFRSCRMLSNRSDSALASRILAPLFLPLSCSALNVLVSSVRESFQHAIDPTYTLVTAHGQDEMDVHPRHIVDTKHASLKAHMNACITQGVRAESVRAVRKADS